MASYLPVIVVILASLVSSSMATTCCYSAKMSARVIHNKVNPTSQFPTEYEDMYADFNQKKVFLDYDQPRQGFVARLEDGTNNKVYKFRSDGTCTKADLTKFEFIRCVPSSSVLTSSSTNNDGQAISTYTFTDGGKTTLYTVKNNGCVPVSETHTPRTTFADAVVFENFNANPTLDSTNIDKDVSNCQ